ncbi:MAG: SpvB/TcaC N-terminal domain-containing protein [Bacteroidota bacterium]
MLIISAFCSVFIFTGITSDAQIIGPLAICPATYLSPSSINATRTGGYFPVTVTTLNNCTNYTVSESLSWVSYTKNGFTVTINVSSNSGPARSGDVLIGGMTLTVNQACGNYPAGAGTITGSNSVCKGQTGVGYSVPAISGATGYVWTLPSGASIASGYNTNSITVNYSLSAVSGTISVYGTNSCGAGGSSFFSVTVNSLPTPTISGTSSVCVNSTGNVYTTQSGMTGYSWSVTGGQITAGGGSGNNTVTVTWTTVGTGHVKVNYTNANGCTATSQTDKPVTVNALPSISISGSASVCAYSTGNVYTTQSGMTNYSWTVTGGTITAGGGSTNNTVTVTWGAAGTGHVKVNYTNASGCTAASQYDKPVTINALPSISISGSASVCAYSTGNVYTTQTGMTNYSWTVTGGTITAGGGSTNNTVTVTWSAAGTGHVKVNYTNASGCTAASQYDLSVSINALPSISISGSASVCAYSTGNVYTTQSGMTNYSWTVTGGTITAGGGSTNNTATITWNTVGTGHVKVNYTNANGCTAASQTDKPVTVNSLPTPTISGPSSACVNSTGNVYTTESGMTGYSWSVTGGQITSGGGSTNNTATITWNTVGTGHVKVNYTNANGCTAASQTDFTVNVIPPPSINYQPIDAIIESDQDALFFLTATGSNPQYQWQSSLNVSGPWTNIEGETNDTLIIINSHIFEPKLYRCKVSYCGYAISDSVKIIIITNYLQGSEIPSINRAIDTSKEVGTTSVSASVSQMGGATINIPIFASPGTNGMTPSISLFYNSQSGNGILGYGWHIGGLSSIARTGRVLFYDNEAAGITYTASDKFVLDGERLMVSEGTYGAANSVYFSESNPFSKITAYGTTGNGPTYFKQETKGGITYEFGNSTDSRHFAGNVSSTVYAWRINKAVDNNGNYIRYNYSNSEGENWLRSIEYTGNSQQSLNPYDSLVFIYTIRTNDNSYYYAGYGHIPKSRLLHNIIVYCEGNQVRKYVFGYTNGFYSQLVEITEYDRNGYKYNSTVIDWGNEGTYQYTSEPYIDRFETDEGVTTGDFNGDGIEEVAYWGSDESGSYLLVYRVGRNNFQGIYNISFDPGYFSPYPKQFSSCTNGDMDGDGTDDLIFTSTDSLFIYYGNHSEEQMFSNHSSQDYNGHLGYSTADFNGDGIGELEGMNTSKKIINFDGDSRADKIVFSSTGYELVTSTLSSGLIASSILRLNNVSEIFEGDFNGDSHTDLLVGVDGDWNIWDYDGSQYSINTDYSVPLGSLDTAAFGTVFFVRDINKDGKSDIIKIKGNDEEHIWYCYLSKGLSFESEQYIVDATKYPAYGDFIFGDFNGEGQLDCFYDLSDLIELKRNDRLNLVEAVLNGLNHKTSFSYLFNVNPSAALSRPQLNTLKYVTLSEFVVSSLTSRGSDSVIRTVEYSYANPIVHIGGKGFLGFANQSSTDNITGISGTTRLEADEEFVYAWPLEQIIKDGEGNTISEKYFTGSVKSYSYGGYLGYISKVISNDILHDISDTTQYYYDSYGNDTLTIVKQDGELVTTTRNQYIQKNTWCPAKIISSELTRTSYDSSPAFQTSSAFGYDNLGRLNRINVFADLSDSLHTEITYNNYGNILTKTTRPANGSSRTETYNYDARQRFVTSLSQGGLSYSYEYDPVTGNVTNEIAPNGLETSITYDGFGRQTKRSVTETQFIETTLGWSDTNGPANSIYYVEQNDAVSSATTWFDNLGKQIRTLSPGFNDSVYIDREYSPRGLVIKESKPFFNTPDPVWNTYTYDNLGRVDTSVINGTTVYYTYEDNNITSELQVTGIDRTNTISYNGLGQAASVTRNGKSLGFEYDNNGKLLNASPPASGSTVSYDYDSKSMLTQESDPDRGDSEYEFNSLGELTGFETANGDKDSIIYDHIGRDSIRIRENGQTRYYYYTSGNGKGRIREISSPAGYKKYSYDIYGNVTRECDSISSTEYFPYSYEYNEFGKLSKMTYPGGFAVKYEYDNGFLKYIKKASDNAVIWQCNSANEYGNITQYSLSGTIITVDKSYNSNGYLTGIKTSAGGTTRQWLRYSFDASTGDLTWRRDSIRNITENFRYDDFDQLEWMEVSGLDSTIMTYDDIGNITFKSDVGDYYYNPTRIHAIDSISDSQFQNRQQIEYNFFNKPDYIADEEDSLNYTYNVLDNRIKATLYGTGGLVKITWYAGLYEKTVENSVTKHYYYINSPDGPVALAIQTGGGTPEFYYLCKDHLGSITGVMNSSGNIVEEYNYDAWGRRRNPTDWSYSNVATPNYTQHGFTGHEHLDMFNLINMNGRIYDSEIARFLSPDPIIQSPYNLLSYNRYSYCLNNPLKYTDPSGYEYDKFLRDMEREQRDDPGPDIMYNNYVDYWGGLQQSFKDRYTYEESEKRKEQEKDKNDKENRPGIVEPNIITESLAAFLATYFPGAVAVFFDGGTTLVGGEVDAGFFIVLAGEDAGSLVLYTEKAGGVSIDGTVGLEMGSVFTDYPSEKFRATDLYGERIKGWLGVGAGVSMSGSLAIAEVARKGKTYSTAFQFGPGFGLFFISGGGNRGNLSDLRYVRYYLKK